MVGGRWKRRRRQRTERCWPDTISLETWGHPAWAVPVTVKNDTALSRGMRGPEDTATGLDTRSCADAGGRTDNARRRQHRQIETP